MASLEHLIVPNLLVHIFSVSGVDYHIFNSKP